MPQNALQVRALEGKLQEYQEVLLCKQCRQVRRQRRGGRGDVDPHPHTHTLPTTKSTRYIPPMQKPRNCVVLPCLHFLYCDDCIKAHVSASPTCPACSCAVSGFQTLMVLR